MPNKLPTEEAYAELQEGYDFYNRKLFGGQLPACMITFQREKQTMGYFSAKRFVRRDGVRTDEIALNPEYFAVVPMIMVLQQLVHEMVHLWQHHFGRPSRSSYHNRQWANKMQSLGLMPTATGTPGGKSIGQKIETYIIPGGAFQYATNELLAQGFAISWMDRFPATPLKLTFPIHPLALPIPTGMGFWLEMTANDHDDQIICESAIMRMKAAYRPPAESGALLNLEPRSLEDRSNRNKYCCPYCKMNVWGKPKLRIKCADCNVLLIDTQKKVAQRRPIAPAKAYYQTQLFPF